MGMTDAAIRSMMDTTPVPTIDGTPWTTPPPLGQATVAIVTTAALHRAGDEGFGATDTGFRVIGRADRDLQLGHWSPNFDHTGFAADLNVVFPIDRLEELAADGTIGAVAPRHFAFAGNQDDTMSRILLDSGPAAARELRTDGVDVVLLTPV